MIAGINTVVHKLDVILIKLMTQCFPANEGVPRVEIEVLDETAVALKVALLENNLAIRGLGDFGFDVVIEFLIRFQHPDVTGIAFNTQCQSRCNYSKTQPYRTVAQPIHSHDHKNERIHRHGEIHALLVFAHNSDKRQKHQKNQSERSGDKRLFEAALHQSHQSDADSQQRRHIVP